MSAILISAMTSCQTITGLFGETQTVIDHPAVPGRGTVIMCHGFRGSKEGGGRAAALARQIATLGLRVVRFDFTPLGTLSQQIAEIAAVVTVCRRQFPGRIILHGRSMGGSAALAYTAKDQAIGGLCLWSTPWDLAATFAGILGEGYAVLLSGKPWSAKDEFGQVTLQPDFVADFARHDLLACARALPAIPVLIVHGAQDEVVPCRQAHELLAACCPPKELRLLPEGDHRFLTSHSAASALMMDWLERSF